jgi:hypothetical protein
MWASYEKDYIGELMVIERDARRFIVEAVNAETALQVAEKAQDKPKLEQAQTQLIAAIGAINTVANVDGKGRDDFDRKTLRRATHIVKGTKQMAPAVTQLA